MIKTDLVAWMLWTGVTAYAVFGGADFGAGFWSLIAGGGGRGRRARELIDWAIGPVWEANHVWLGAPSTRRRAASSAAGSPSACSGSRRC